MEVDMYYSTSVALNVLQLLIEANSCHLAWKGQLMLNVVLVNGQRPCLHTKNVMATECGKMKLNKFFNKNGSF